MVVRDFVRFEAVDCTEAEFERVIDLTDKSNTVWIVQAGDQLIIMEATAT